MPRTLSDQEIPICNCPVTNALCGVDMYAHNSINTGGDSEAGQLCGLITEGFCGIAAIYELDVYGAGGHPFIVNDEDNYPADFDEFCEKLEKGIDI